MPASTKLKSTSLSEPDKGIAAPTFSRRIFPQRKVRRETLISILFVMPALLMYAVFVLLPFLLSIYYSIGEKKEKLQSLVEKIHTQWRIDTEYMDPPSTGTLVSLDPELIVQPPAGFEVGYVPIVTGQK